MTQDEAIKVLRDACAKAFSDGERYWQQADSDSSKQQVKSVETLRKYKESVEVACDDLRAQLAARIEPAANDKKAEEVVTALYRRFKDWSKRGFGPDDVTWCEVKADVESMIALYSAPHQIAHPAPSVPELSRLDQECLRIGQEMRRVAGVMPEGWTMEIHVERGYGGVIAYDEAHDQKLACDAGECDGMSYAISNVLDSAISAAAPKQNDGGE